MGARDACQLVNVFGPTPQEIGESKAGSGIERLGDLGALSIWTMRAAGRCSWNVSLVLVMTCLPSSASGRLCASDTPLCPQAASRQHPIAYAVVVTGYNLSRPSRSSPQ